MIQDGKLRGFAMGHAVPVRTDYTAGEVRRFARRAKDGAQARRLLALAAVLNGASREEAAKIGGMDRQTLRDWVIRYNEQEPDGLINIPSPGAPPVGDHQPVELAGHSGAGDRGVGNQRQAFAGAV